MAIRFFFEYNNTIVQLPVNPEKITISSKGNNSREEIVKIGEISILKDRKLQSLEISSFFPADSSGPYVLTKGKFKKPKFYLNFFNKIIADKKPVRFIIGDTKVNFLASIESFEWSLQAGDEDTRYKLKIQEYRLYSAKTVTINNKKSSSTPKKTSDTKPKATVKQPERPKTGFSIGDTVIVNGKYWYTSYGESPFGTFKNFTGKIAFIVADKSRKYRYSITTLDGGYRGWVEESQMKHI